MIHLKSFLNLNNSTRNQKLVEKNYKESDIVKLNSGIVINKEFYNINNIVKILRYIPINDNLKELGEMYDVTSFFNEDISYHQIYRSQILKKFTPKQAEIEIEKTQKKINLIQNTKKFNI